MSSPDELEQKGTTAAPLGGGRVLATVVAFGYAAFLAGPALIGLAVARVGIQHAMLVPVATAAVLVVLGTWLGGVGTSAQRL